ncbi:MAG: hypothetical protein J6X31_07375, partial [Bacteroidales bacterium]|nr:hypothetical protein [Bacteroidales bacterium]
MLVLPALDTNVYHANETELIFSSYCGSTYYTNQAFEIGVLDDAMDFSTFTPVDSVYAVIPVGEWHTFLA